MTLALFFDFSIANLGPGIPAKYNFPEEMVLYLCSDKAGFITGENICIDGGMTRQMIYHNDFGWKLEE